MKLLILFRNVGVPKNQETIHLHSYVVLCHHTSKINTICLSLGISLQKFRRGRTEEEGRTYLLYHYVGRKDKL